MKRHRLVAVVIGSCFLTSLGSVAFSADSSTTEAEAVISKFFKAFYAKSVKGMAAVSAPSATIIDYGQSCNLDEWSWFMQFQFDHGPTYDVPLSDFNTKIQGNLAYTSFRMSGAELGNAVLKRTDGKWYIDLLTIEKEQKWLPWLRNRASKGQDVSEWYDDYLKENPYGG